MPHARTIHSRQAAPVRSPSTGRVSITEQCRTLLAERAPGTDAAVALLPLLELQWDKHVKARRAVRADETPARAARAEKAFDACTEVAEAIISGPMPRTLDGLRALSLAVSCAYEGCLDDLDSTHITLKRLVCGVMMVLEGAEPPDGFETFSQKGFTDRR